VELSRDVISTLSNSIGNYFTFPFISSVSERHGHSWGDLGLVREKRKAGPGSAPPAGTRGAGRGAAVARGASGAAAAPHGADGAAVSGGGRESGGPVVARGFGRCVRCPQSARRYASDPRRGCRIALC